MLADFAPNVPDISESIYFRVAARRKNKQKVKIKF
jgi:hypothetical protein